MPSTAQSTLTPEAVLEAIRDPQAEIAALEAEISHLKSRLDSFLDDGQLQHLTSEDGKNFKHLGITLSRSKRTTWKYDPHVKNHISSIQSMAQINGDATSTTTYFWSVKCQP